MSFMKRLTAAMLVVLIMACCFMSVFALAAGEESGTRGTTEGYTLTELDDTVVIEDDDTPLANLQINDEACCILHLFLIIGALLVAVYYTHAEKMSQLREFELRRELGR